MGYEYMSVQTLQALNVLLHDVFSDSSKACLILYWYCLGSPSEAMKPTQSLTSLLNWILSCKWGKEPSIKSGSTCIPLANPSFTLGKSCTCKSWNPLFQPSATRSDLNPFHTSFQWFKGNNTVHPELAQACLAALFLCWSRCRATYHCANRRADSLYSGEISKPLHAWHDICWFETIGGLNCLIPGLDSLALRLGSILASVNKNKFYTNAALMFKLIRLSLCICPLTVAS